MYTCVEKSFGRVNGPLCCSWSVRTTGT